MNAHSFSRASQPLLLFPSFCFRHYTSIIITENEHGDAWHDLEDSLASWRQPVTAK